LLQRLSDARSPPEPIAPEGKESNESNTPKPASVTKATATVPRFMAAD